MSGPEEGIRPDDVTVEPDGDKWRARCHRDDCGKPPMLTRRMRYDAEADRLLHLNWHVMQEVKTQ